MSNTSATGGILTPTASPAPLEGAALYDFFQTWIAAITGLANTLVFPRWQPEPPNLPQASVTWAAFGIVRRESDTFQVDLHYPTGAGYNEIRRHEILNFLISFYGPDADNYCHIFREGIQIPQNGEYLKTQNMGVIESGEAIAVPELVKDKWYYRTDLPFRIKRQIVRQYAIQNIQSANLQLDNEIYTTNITVQGSP